MIIPTELGFDMMGKLKNDSELKMGFVAVKFGHFHKSDSFLSQMISHCSNVCERVY